MVFLACPEGLRRWLLESMAAWTFRPAAGAGGPVEIFDYPGTGHLFTDPSLPAEYDEHATSLLWERALAFCRSPHSDTHRERAPPGAATGTPQPPPGGSDQGHRLAR